MPRPVWALISHTARRNCWRKQRHKSRGAAEAHIRAAVEQLGDESMNAYACGVCGGWHVGHNKYERKEAVD